jgi:hypothetical protein
MKILNDHDRKYSLRHQSKTAIPLNPLFFVSSTEPGFLRRFDSCKNIAM